MTHFRRPEAKTPDTKKPALPWRLSLIGGAATLFHVAAAYDYVMTLTQGDAYMQASGMTAAQIAYFSNLPPWVVASWTVSVWSGLFGSLFLLARRPTARGLLLLASAGTAGYVAWTLMLSKGGMAAMGALWFMPMVVGAGTLALAAYAGQVAAGAMKPVQP